MHSLYLQKCDEVSWPSVIEPAYLKMFCKQFNFGFGSPRSDTCKTCDSFNCQINDASDATVKQLLATARKHVVAYSDSCGGQNKSFYIVCFWIYLLIKGCCETIDHKFLTPGHTYLPSDRDFALIEKKKKETEIFVPMQWFNLVEGTRVQKPFRVARMKREDIKDFKIFCQLEAYC